MPCCGEAISRMLFFTMTPPTYECDNPRPGWQTPLSLVASGPQPGTLVHQGLQELDAATPDPSAALRDWLAAATAHRPFVVTLTAFAVQQAVRTFAGNFPGRAGVLHGLVLPVIASLACLAGEAACWTPGQLLVAAGGHTHK